MKEILEQVENKFSEDTVKGNYYRRRTCMPGHFIVDVKRCYESSRRTYLESQDGKVKMERKIL